MHLFCETQKILYIDFLAVVQHCLACETSEDLMLVGADKLYIGTGGSVYNGNKVHFKTAVVAGEGPR